MKFLEAQTQMLCTSEVTIKQVDVGCCVLLATLCAHSDMLSSRVLPGLGFKGWWLRHTLLFIRHCVAVNMTWVLFCGQMWKHLNECPPPLWWTCKVLHPWVLFCKTTVPDLIQITVDWEIFTLKIIHLKFSWC